MLETEETLYNHTIERIAEICDDAGTAVYPIRGIMSWLEKQAENYESTGYMPKSAAHARYLRAELEKVFAGYAHRLNPKD